MTTPQLADIKISSYEISLTKLTGCAIADIAGYITEEFGDPNFKITRIIFADGQSIDVGAEHDCPFLYREEEEVPNLNEDALNALLEQEN